MITIVVILTIVAYIGAALKQITMILESYAEEDIHIIDIIDIHLARMFTLTCYVSVVCLLLVASRLVNGVPLPEYDVTSPVTLPTFGTTPVTPQSDSSVLQVTF